MFVKAECSSFILWQANHDVGYFPEASRGLLVIYVWLISRYVSTGLPLLSRLSHRAIFQVHAPLALQIPRYRCPHCSRCTLQYLQVMMSLRDIFCPAFNYNNFRNSEFQLLQMLQTDVNYTASCLEMQLWSRGVHNNETWRQKGVQMLEQKAILLSQLQAYGVNQEIPLGSTHSQPIIWRREHLRWWDWVPVQDSCCWAGILELE